MPRPTKVPASAFPDPRAPHAQQPVGAAFQHKRITTTLTKAKRLRPVAERFITFGKKGDLAARRRVLRSITDKSVVHELFTVIAPAMAERPGGYTRIIKIGNRKGDNAPMAVIELVMEPVATKGAVAEATKVAEKAAEAPKAEAAGGPARRFPRTSGVRRGSRGFEVKGNADSMKYHVPGSRWYSSTKAEIWFDSAESAEAAGYAPAGGAAATEGFRVIRIPADLG